MTREKGPATELEPRTYTLSWSFSHRLLVPVANPLPDVPVVGVPLYSNRLKTHASRLVQCVCDGNGLSGQQRVAWTHEPVVDGVSCLCLAMLVQVLCSYPLNVCPSQLQLPISNISLSTTHSVVIAIS